MSSDFVRVGVAFGEPRGPSRRRDEYEILELSSAYGVSLEPPARYARYVGYREDSPAGEVWVGLPLSGPTRVYRPLLDFKPGMFAEVRFFPDQ